MRKPFLTLMEITVICELITSAEKMADGATLSLREWNEKYSEKYRYGELVSKVREDIKAVKYIDAIRYRLGKSKS